MGSLQTVMDRLREEYGEPGEQERPDPVILSQNTNDTNRDRAYSALMERYESPEDIMEAETEELAETISVAGLHNTKAERIQESLERIEQERGELSLGFLAAMELEEAKDWLQELPGVGPKSAAVVLNFTFDRAAFPVDTHV
ncbi:MAG: helix-hairpin-helix domain-containing protein, partial [Candidatus Nanohaloarchaea archaeon]|nr:helix-hairpin-helix domain-containing protein [Candidatus Nanohaloarchaea archaeon]